MAAAYRTPPVFDIDNTPYSRWIEEINAWKELTDLTENKHGLAVALSLPENDRSGIRDRVFSDGTSDDLKGENGITKLTTYMDQIVKKDELSDAYETACDFYRFH